MFKIGDKVTYYSVLTIDEYNTSKVGEIVNSTDMIGEDIQYDIKFSDECHVWAYSEEITKVETL